METKDKTIYESPKVEIHETSVRSMICASILETEKNTSYFNEGEELNF